MDAQGIKEQSVIATLYPKKIIIATRITDKYNSTWTTTDCLSILSTSVSNEELGTIVLRHIALSEVRELYTGEAMDLRERYKKLTKFKTEGQLMKNAKFATVFFSEDQIRFEPKNNRYSEVKQRYYEYVPMPESIFNIDYPCTHEEIGLALRSAWDHCIIS